MSRTAPSTRPQFVAESGATPAAGMVAVLTATVRAPVTGMILIFEMTGAFNQALPILWACFAAMAIATLMGNSPIYNSMKTRSASNKYSRSISRLDRRAFNDNTKPFSHPWLSEQTRL